VGAHPLPQTPTPLAFHHARRLEPLSRRCTGCDLMRARKRVRKRTLQLALMRRSKDRKKTLPDPDSLKGVTPTKIINLFLRRVWTGQFRSKPCSHVHLARADIGPASEVCAECVALGDSWPALRMCLLCGYVGCCDKSKNKHAREHFRQTGHPLTRPYKERGMDWVWCYVDEALLDPR
jgi:hypothetical protein